MKNKKNLIVKISLLLFLLTLSAGANIFAAETDDHSYYPVRVTGNLQQKDGKLYLEDKFMVNPGALTPEPGCSEIFGAVFPAGEGRLPELYILTIKKIGKCQFSITKWNKPLKLTGRRPEVIMQHPVEPSLGKIDYFEINRWQIVVYFKSDSEYNKYQAVKSTDAVTLSGTLQPVFAGSKNPKDIGTLKKHYQGYRIIDTKVIEVK